MHPGTRILLYVLSALVVPGLNFFQLGILTGVMPLLCLSRIKAVWRLLRRARWLLLLLTLAYAYNLPGEALLPAVGGLSPTREGLQHGLTQAWRLAALLVLLDWLVLRLPTSELLTGVHAVLRPFAWLGLDPQRAALRLALTMQAMERPRGLQGFRELLDGQIPGGDLPAEYLLTIRPFRTVDLLLLSGFAAVALLWFIA